MSLKAIKQITETEHAAQKCIEDAQIKARDIIAEAQRTASAEYDSAMKQAAEKSALMLANARQRGEALAAEQQKQFKRDCTVLHGQALSRMDSAVAVVMERVVG